MSKSFQIKSDQFLIALINQINMPMPIFIYTINFYKIQISSSSY